MKDELAGVNKLVPIEPNNEWAESFCRAVNWHPDGTENKFVEGQLHSVTFRDLAKGFIAAVLATAPEAEHNAALQEKPGSIRDALQDLVAEIRAAYRNAGCNNHLPLGILRLTEQAEKVLAGVPELEAKPAAVPDIEWAISRIARDIAELPDRTSPEDHPDALVVTAPELREIVLRHIDAAPEAQPAPVPKDAEEAFENQWDIYCERHTNANGTCLVNQSMKSAYRNFFMAARHTFGQDTRLAVEDQGTPRTDRWSFYVMSGSIAESIVGRKIVYAFRAEKLERENAALNRQNSELVKLLDAAADVIHEVYQPHGHELAKQIGAFLKSTTPQPADETAKDPITCDQYTETELRHIAEQAIKGMLGTARTMAEAYLASQAKLAAVTKDRDESEETAAEEERSGSSAVSPVWQPIETAPRDGTLLLLALAPDDKRENPLEDTYGLSRTIGFNELENTGEDVWFMAGWSWGHDDFTVGRGSPVLWAPVAEAPEEEGQK